MFPVVCPKTSMRDAFIYLFFFQFIGNTAIRNLFINRTERNTCKNNAIGRGPILFDVCFVNKSETDLKYFIYHINITDVKK